MKTRDTDFSPFLRTGSNKNTGGILARALLGIANMQEEHGQNSDGEILKTFSDELDSNKIKEADFYDVKNAFIAKDIIEKNKKTEKTQELEARNDAEYYKSVFTKEAVNDAVLLDKKDWNKKYADAGGLDAVAVNGIWNDKSDRAYIEKKRILDEKDRNIRNNRASIKWKEYNSNKNKKQKNETFMNDLISGKITKVEDLGNYTNITASNLSSAKNYLTDAKNKTVISDIASKYTSLTDLKKSDEYKNLDFTQKEILAKSKIWGKPQISLKDSITNEMINNRKSDLVEIEKEYKEKYNEDMPLYKKSAFVYKGEVPEKLKESKSSNLKPLTTKEAKSLDGLIKYQDTLSKLEKAYDSSYVGGVDASLNNISPNFVLSDGHRLFNTLMNDVTLGKTSSLAGTLSDKDMALLQASGLSDNLGEKDFKTAIEDSKSNIEKLITQRYKLLKEEYTIPEHYDFINNSNPKKKQVKIKSVRSTNNKVPVSTGMHNGKKVIKYSNGVIEYAN